MVKVRVLVMLAFCGLVAAGLASSTGVLRAQANQLQFVVGATDEKGEPVTDLKPEEVIMSENGKPGKTVSLEPFHIPVKLTIGVDNSPDSREALSHYRSGLKALVETLQPEIEVTLITTAPQPRMVVRPTTNREQILRGINGFAPGVDTEDRPRFTDTMVEYSQRLEKEAKGGKGIDFVPVLLMISTTANEQTSYQVPEVEKALTFLGLRKARVMVVMTSTKTGDATAVADLNTNRQAIIAIPVTKSTRGRYESIGVSSRLVTLLPEFGKDIAALHARHYNQYKVTVERAGGLTGPLQNPTVELTRTSLKGAVSPDGLP